MVMYPSLDIILLGYSFIMKTLTSRWTRQRLWAGVLSGISLLSLSAHAATNDPLVVHTQAGEIQGKSLPYTRTWQGIPYAQPPVGNLRWKAPQPVKHWQGIKTALKFGASCMQTPPPKGPEAVLSQRPMSEDCLTLNIWQPKRRFEEHKYPVMVWIHGGAFRMGGTSLKLYDGAKLAQKGVLVVTLNYRLGPLSVFPHPALDKEEHGKALNFGLLDQIAALKWIKHNIAQFGGDPNNVTIWGESAGGASVGYLMTSSQTKGLFNKAIMESGALALPEFTRQQAVEGIQQQLPKTIAKMTPKQLRAIPAKQLLTLPLAKTTTMPIIDGVSLTEKTQVAMAKGDYQHVPLVIGSNSDEAGFFPPAWAASVKEKLGKLWPQAEQLTDGYGTHSIKNKEFQLATDIFATMNTRRFATSSVNATQTTWRYYFSYISPGDNRGFPGAIHTGEIPYVFGNIDQLPFQAVPEDKALANNMMERWVHFAKHGNPNPIAFGTWPQYNPQQKETLWKIDVHGEQPINEPGKARLDFLQQHPEVQLN